jgi:hypothetical protein
MSFDCVFIGPIRAHFILLVIGLKDGQKWTLLTWRGKLAIVFVDFEREAFIGKDLADILFPSDFPQVARITTSTNSFTFARTIRPGVIMRFLDAQFLELLCIVSPFAFNGDSNIYGKNNH